MSSGAPTSLLLPRRTLVLWLSAFSLPAAYHLLLVGEDLLHLGWSQSTGRPAQLFALLLRLVFSGALLLCWWFVSMSSARLKLKLGWLLFTVAAMVLQYVLLWLALAFFYLFRHGLEGVF